MKTLIQSAIVATLGLAALGASAGEISGTYVEANGAQNVASQEGTYAYQAIGNTGANGRILNKSEIWARGTLNQANGYRAVANQYIGTVEGTMSNSKVYAEGVKNYSEGNYANATQFIGSVFPGGKMTDSTIGANNVSNIAAGSSAHAEQRIGVVN